MCVPIEYIIIWYIVCESVRFHRFFQKNLTASKKKKWPIIPSPHKCSTLLITHIILYIRHIHSNHIVFTSSKTEFRECLPNRRQLMLDRSFFVSWLWKKSLCVFLVLVYHNKNKTNLAIILNPPGRKVLVNQIWTYWSHILLIYSVFFTLPNKYCAQIV